MSLFYFYPIKLLEAVTNYGKVDFVPLVVLKIG